MGQIRSTNTVITVPAGAIGNEDFSSDSGRALAVEKQKHLFKVGTNLGFAIGATPTTREELVFVASTAGTIRGFHAMLVTDGSSTSITFDLKKNGTTMLSSVITVTNTTGDGVVVDGTLSTTTFAADDRLSIAMAVSSSTGAAGPYAFIELEELAA